MKRINLTDMSSERVEEISNDVRRRVKNLSSYIDDIPIDAPGVASLKMTCCSVLLLDVSGGSKDKLDFLLKHLKIVSNKMLEHLSTRKDE